MLSKSFNILFPSCNKNVLCFSSYFSGVHFKELMKLPCTSLLLVTFRGFSFHHRLITPSPVYSEGLILNSPCSSSKSEPHVLSSACAALYNLPSSSTTLFKGANGLFLVFSISYHLLFLRNINPTMPFLSENCLKVSVTRHGIRSSGPHELLWSLFSRTCCYEGSAPLPQWTLKNLATLPFPNACLLSKLCPRTLSSGRKMIALA